MAANLSEHKPCKVAESDTLKQEKNVMRGSSTQHSCGRHDLATTLNLYHELNWSHTRIHAIRQQQSMNNIPLCKV